MPVSLWNRATSSRSRLWLEPTALSPMNVIFWPLYFLRSAFAPATAGGLIAAAAEGVRAPFDDDVPALTAAVTTSRAARANAAVSPPTTRTARCFTLPTSFLQTRWIRVLGDAPAP